jgi:uncharacterized protein (TIGR02646 family)
MRPVNRGLAPGEYSRYENAKSDLVNQLGSYCSYCERRIATNLAVEHIQPKGLPQYVHLKREWTNFLLGCVNCNSAKSNTAVELDAYLLPDRDNTFAAFTYTEDGMVEPAAGLDADLKTLATATKDLVALNKVDHPDWNEAVLFSALERVSQRVQAWVQAKEARQDYEAGNTWEKAIAREAAGSGFFSIWMEAFVGVPVVREKLINAFPGTATDCFDGATSPVCPRPDNGLAHAGKI